MDIHIHHHHDEARCEVMRRLDALDEKIDLVLKDRKTIMATIAELKAVVTLLQGISQEFKDAQAANDPAAIQTVIDQLDANTKTMSDAVTANTPAA